MKITRVLSIAAAIAAGSVSLPFTHPCRAAVPPVMSYSGKLTDAAGRLVEDGSYEMRFSLYAADSGGTALWAETWEAPSAVPVTNGQFGAMLGSHTPLSLPFDEGYWLGVEVKSGGSWEALSPRQRIASAAYAFMAETAHNVPDGSITLDKLDTAGIPGLDSDGYSVLRVPAVTSIDPDTMGDGYPPFTATITGSGFQSGSRARIGTTDLESENAVDSTVLTALVPAGLEAGAHDVSVSNIDLQWGTAHALFSVVTATPTPTPTPTPTMTPTSTPIPGSCKAIVDAGASSGDGVYSIDPDGPGGSAPFQVYCDMTTDGGGWTLAGFRGSYATGPTFSAHGTVHTAFDENQSSDAWSLQLDNSKINNSSTAYDEMAVTVSEIKGRIQDYAKYSVYKWDGTYKVTTDWDTRNESGYSFSYKCSIGAAYETSSNWHSNNPAVTWYPMAKESLTHPHFMYGFCGTLCGGNAGGVHGGDHCIGTFTANMSGYIWVR